MRGNTKIVNLSDETLKLFKIKFIRHSGEIYLSSVLDSKDNRYVIDTKTSELFDKKSGKCYILNEETNERLFDICKYAFIMNY